VNLDFTHVMQTTVFISEFLFYCSYYYIIFIQQFKKIFFYLSSDRYQTLSPIPSSSSLSTIPIETFSKMSTVPEGNFNEFIQF